jgi:hypothetical protein
MTWQGWSRTQSLRWSRRVTVPRWLHPPPRKRGQVVVMGTRVPGERTCHGGFSDVGEVSFCLEQGFNWCFVMEVQPSNDHWKEGCILWGGVSWLWSRTMGGIKSSGLGFMIEALFFSLES